MQDIGRIHEMYYQDAMLQSKKQFILQNCSVSSAARHRRNSSTEAPTTSSQGNEEMHKWHEYPELNYYTNVFATQIPSFQAVPAQENQHETTVMELHKPRFSSFCFK